MSEIYGGIDKPKGKKVAAVKYRVDGYIEVRDKEDAGRVLGDLHRQICDHLDRTEAERQDPNRVIIKSVEVGP